MQCKGNNRKSKTNSGNRGLVLTGVRVETFNLPLLQSVSACALHARKGAKKDFCSVRGVKNLAFSDVHLDRAELHV